MNIKNNDYFIKKAKKIHGDKYDYSKVEYKNTKTKVCIICSEHGEFWQTPEHHYAKHGCPVCANRYNALTTEEFIKKAKAIHGDRYDYSKTNYIDYKTKVCIICPIHGEFYILPLQHIGKKARGCPICGKIQKAISNTCTTEEFIKKAKKIHGDKYDYSRVNYIHSTNEVCIICPIHGEFYMSPNSHLQNHGCPICSCNQKLTLTEFVERAKKVHGNKYDYSNSIYYRSDKLIKIICPIHGEFEQKAINHLKGCGCPICKESKLEKEIDEFLIKNNISFERQKKFDWLNNENNLQSLDFYLPDYNVAIECQGIQHFKPSNYFGGEKRFKKQKELDINKFEKCKEHNIKILYFSHHKYEYFKKIINNSNNILNELSNE